MKEEYEMELSNKVSGNCSLISEKKTKTHLPCIMENVSFSPKIKRFLSFQL